MPPEVEAAIGSNTREKGFVPSEVRPANDTATDVGWDGGESGSRHLSGVRNGISGCRVYQH
jgi:hypothetical protein